MGKILDHHLHGDNDYRFSEYTSKRKIVSQALKELILRGYIIPHCNKSGFNYSISRSGTMFCRSLNDKCAEDFTDIVKKTDSLFFEYSDRELIYIINEYAINMVRGTRV